MQRILNIPFVDNSQFEHQCQAYVQLLSYWNSSINLVSARDVDNLLTRLIEQSVKPLTFFDIPQHARMLDVGSGAGIPALPLKFARQNLQLTLLEPRRKKCLFLSRAAEELHLDDVEVVRGRLEDFCVRADWQGAFDLITTRGTGSAGKLFPFFEPLIKPGGMCWIYKGLAARRELKELELLTPHPVRLLELDKKMSLIVVQL